MLERIDLALKRADNAINTKHEGLLLCKLYFKSEQNKSAKASGNRCIVVRRAEENVVRVLLVYCKVHIKGAHETV